MDTSQTVCPESTEMDFRLGVTLDSAKGLTGKDANGLSDPYCVFEIMPFDAKAEAKHRLSHLSAHSRMSSTKHDTLDPKWDEHFEFQLPAHGRWEDYKLCVYMWDFDGDRETNVSSVKGTFKMMKDAMRRSDPDSFLGQ